eukprot:2284073-Pyramimonas_sp.AAC.1
MQRESRGEKRWEKVGNWGGKGEGRGRVSTGVLRAPSPLLAQEDPSNEVILIRIRIIFTRVSGL